MASAVTIGSSSSKSVVLQFDSSSNNTLAAQIASQINAGIKGGSVVLTADTLPGASTIPGGALGAHVQTTPNPYRLTATSPFDFVKTGSYAVVLGTNTANQTVLSDADTKLTFLANAGSGTVVGGGSSNRIAVFGPSTGSWALYTGNGNDVISALGGVNATIGAGAGDNAIALGSGNDFVVSSGNDLISAGSGSTTVDATGAQNDLVHAGSGNLLFLGGAGGATITGGSGSDTYLGGAGWNYQQYEGQSAPQIIKGGSAGNNLLIAGDGAATLMGGGNNDQLYAYGLWSQQLDAAGGNATLSAALSGANNVLKAGSGNDLVIAGIGQDTVVGGSGHATVQADSGTTFQFVNQEAGGTEMVSGIFDPSSIHIDLQGYGGDAVQRALDSQTTKNGAVTVSLSDGTKITFEDVTSLNRSNFTTH